MYRRVANGNGMHYNTAKLEKDVWLRCRKCTDAQPTEIGSIMCETVKGHWIAYL